MSSKSDTEADANDKYCVQGDFRHFLAALKEERVPFSLPNFCPKLEVIEHTDTGILDVTFTALDGRITYTQSMSPGQWELWQARARKEAEFTFSNE